MNQLMKDLFFAIAPTLQQEEEARVIQATEEVFQAAQKRLGDVEFERLWSAFFRIDHANDVDSFILGFRLGMQLTLEGLRPAVPE